MHKTIKKTVTFTTCKLSQIEIVNGEPIAVDLGTETIIGNKNQKQMQKEISKLYEGNVTVYNLETTTKQYEMSLEQFIETATLKEEDNE